ncbi:hypothetical protein C8R45DRAFT_923463 [Mycena sanguinolenta]|nr:hypothetical protein C8R45DRAFT_923463 [Mycena sanguinolenta]
MLLLFPGLFLFLLIWLTANGSFHGSHHRAPAFPSHGQLRASRATRCLNQYGPAQGGIGRLSLKLCSRVKVCGRGRVKLDNTPASMWTEDIREFVIATWSNPGSLWGMWSRVAPKPPGGFSNDITFGLLLLSPSEGKETTTMMRGLRTTALWRKRIQRNTGLQWDKPPRKATWTWSQPGSHASVATRVDPHNLSIVFPADNGRNTRAVLFEVVAGRLSVSLFTRALCATKVPNQAFAERRRR